MLNNCQLNDLFDYPNRYIYQNPNGFKFSLDSILLAEFVKIKPNAKILDMCTGNAPIPLILSLQTKSEIIGFEIQKEISDLAIESIKYNNLEKQIKIYNEDIKNIEKIFPGKYFDIITCNPPYFKYNKNNQELNKNEIKSLARHEVTITLEDIFKIVSQVLKDNGSFYLVHRLERLDEIILNAEKNKLKVKEMQIVVTKENDPKIVLFCFKKHSQWGIKINKIVNVDKLTSYQQIFKED